MDDPVVAEYDVVLVRPVGGSELSLVQFPTRPEFRRAAFASPTGARVRPRHQMLTLTYQGLQDSANDDVEAPIVKMRSSRAKLPTRGGLAYVHGGTVHLFPVRNVLQMRPDFSAIDAADEELLNAEVKRKEEVKEEEAVTEVKQTYKKAESQQSGARRLRSYKFKIEEEDKDRWVELEVPSGDRDAGEAAARGGDALWARGGVHALRWENEGEGGEGQTKREVVAFESSWERYLTPTAAAAVPTAAHAESDGDGDGGAARRAPEHDAVRRVEGLLASSMRGIQTVSMRAWGPPTLELHAWRGLPALAQMHAIVLHSRVVRFATLKRLVAQLSFTCGSSAAVRSISARRVHGAAAAGGGGESDAGAAMEVEGGGADLDPTNVGGDAALIAMLSQVADLVQGCWVIKSALAPTVRRAPSRSGAGEGTARESGAVADAHSAVRKRLGNAANGAAGSFVERVEGDAAGLPWSVVAPLNLGTLRNAAVRDRVLLEFVRRGAVARGAGRVKEEASSSSDGDGGSAAAAASAVHIHRRDLQAVVQPMGVGRTALIAQLKSVASLKHRETGAGASANWVFELAHDDEFIAAHGDVVAAHHAEWERRAASIDAMLRATCPAGARGAVAAAAAPSAAASGAASFARRTVAASVETSRSDIALAISLALRNSSGKPTPIVETVGRVAAAALAEHGVLQRGVLLRHVEAHDEVLSVAKSLVRAGDTAALIRAALASLLDSESAALVIPVGGAPTRGGVGAQRYALHNERTNARNASDRAHRTVVATLFSGVGGAAMSVKKKDIVAAVKKAHGASATITTAAYNRVMKEFATSEKNSWTLKLGGRL